MIMPSLCKVWTYVYVAFYSYGFILFLSFELHTKRPDMLVGL